MWKLSNGARNIALRRQAIERGSQLITALLAVLKAGGAYLAIDTSSPAPRVAAMIAAAAFPKFHAQNFAGFDLKAQANLTLA